jgi:transcriptional regulator with XRE-family HTH domain
VVKELTPIHIRVEQVRKRKGVTKAHIARRCGHSPSWYHDISKGRRKMTVETLEQIADVLEVPVTHFFEDKISESLTKDTGPQQTA